MKYFKRLFFRLCCKLGIHNPVKHYDRNSLTVEIICSRCYKFFGYDVVATLKAHLYFAEKQLKDVLRMIEEEEKNDAP